MKLRVRLLENIIELPEHSVATANRCALRHLLDDLGLEVKGVEASEESGITFTIETLANRGDHLSVVGVAREIAARNLVQMKALAIAPQLPEKKASLVVRRVTEKCSRYALLEMTLPSPMTLRNDVAAFVVDPGKHHAIVALLNYVQQELGQPMHAFDAEKVDGEIIIDTATQRETIEALDGKTYEVPEGSILIRDTKKIIAVAGVIGCANSMVTETTKKVLIEAATFDPVSVRVTARAMGISTDASYAFERGCDPEGIHTALRRLVHLAEGSAGVAMGVQSTHVLGFTYAEASPPEKRKITIPLSEIRKHLNLPRLEESELTARLKLLGYGVEVTSVGKDREFALLVPSWRLWDINAAQDIIEEVARAVGYGRVKLELPALDYALIPPNPVEAITAATRAALRGHGFVEVITKGFYSEDEVSRLEELHPGSRARHIALKNAIEQSYSHMKVTNVTQLTKLIATNRKRGITSAKVFEIGRVFSQPEESPSREPRKSQVLEYDYEHDQLTLAASGRWHEGEWRKPEQLDEFARLFTGTLSGLIKGLGGTFSVSKSSLPYLHPNMQGSIKMGRTIVGAFGVVHPRITELYDLKENVMYAELDLRILHKLMDHVPAPPLSDFPIVWRDITLKVPLHDQAGRVLRIVDEAQSASLKDTFIVDDFRKSDEEFRRVTYRLTFQLLDRTLRSEEVDEEMARLLESVRVKAGIEMAA